ncbi:MAG: porin [Methylibium sp.]|nr:porin [Methylibium sp.]
MALAGTSAGAETAANAADETGERGERPWRFGVGGRIQLDHDTFEGVYSNEGESVSETYLRRARIEFSGRAGEHWKFGLDIAPLENGSGTLDTLIVAYRGLGPIDVSVGRFKPDFSLEEAISSKWVTGIERSAIWDLAPDAADRDGSWGLDLRTHGKHHHASVGFFNKPDQKAQALRFAVAPLLQRERILHLGVSFSREDIEDSDGQIRTRLGVRGVTENDDGNRVTLARSEDEAFDGDDAGVLEFAYAQGPYSVQSEYLQRRLSGVGDQPRRTARGYYVQFAYTLTGEARPYEIDGAKFDEIRPADKAKGAWEVFYRHDRMAVEGEEGLLSRDRSKARARVHALGLNWYATRKLRLSLNHLWGTTDGIDNDAGDSSGRGLSLRLQVLL